MLSLPSMILRILPAPLSARLAFEVILLEMNVGSLLGNKTLEIFGNISFGIKPIGSQWVYKLKRNIDGTIKPQDGPQSTFPSTSKLGVIKILLYHKAHPTIIGWASSWLSDRSMETWIDGKSAGKMNVNCEVPQGSPRSQPYLLLHWQKHWER